VFDVIKSIFDKNSEMIGGSLKCKEKVRKIFTQVVNSLTSKSEIGGPMASLYLLGTQIITRTTSLFLSIGGVCQGGAQCVG